jgi:hypothetical protein
MLAACAKGMEGNLFPLWSRTNFKVTLDESIWVIFMVKNFHNGTNIIAKHDTIFQGE